MVLCCTQTSIELRERYKQQVQQLRAARESLAAAAQQSLQFFTQAAAELSGADVLIATPQTLLQYVQAAGVYDRAVENASKPIMSPVFGVLVDDDSDSDADSDEDEQLRDEDADTAAGVAESDGEPVPQSSSDSSSSSSELIDLSQVYWFVADDSKLRGAVQQQSEATAKQLFAQQDAWFEHLQRVAKLLPRAEKLCDEYAPATAAADIEMSRAARMVYLAEVR
jgi:hypothetical protein